MKLTKTKKTKIYNVVEKLYNYGCEHVISAGLPEKALNKIVEIHDNKKSRSLPEHRLYFAQCEFIARHISEQALKAFDLEYATIDFIHMLIKTHLKITSTAFDNLEQGAFNEFHTKGIEWISMFIFKMNSETFNQWFNEEA